MYTLELTLSAAPGALLRVIGTAERRGWRPVSVSASCGESGTNLGLQVRGDQPVERLVRQLGRLLDVRAVAVLT